MDTKRHNYGLVRVAAVSPEIKIGDPPQNAEKIAGWMETFNRQDVAIAVFPEMCLTGYTVGDLFFSHTLQESALEGLRTLRKASGKSDTVMVVGLPLRVGANLFNVAAVLHGGEILGFVPKTYLPTYKEFYEKRWFSSSRELTETLVEFDGRKIPIGTDLLFPLQESPGAVLGVEICEDLWAVIPPSSLQALHGANILVNLSASNDVVGKADYRRDLVKQQSARCVAGYIYTSCGSGESTTDLVFGGHLLIAENGSLLEERYPHASYYGDTYAVTEIDVAHLLHDRMQTSDFGEGIHTIGGAKLFRRQEVKNQHHPIAIGQALIRKIDAAPFVPRNGDRRRERAEEIFFMQVRALVGRIRSTKIKNLVIGTSGGLDSTLALLVAMEAASVAGGTVHALSMPAAATNPRTKNNAEVLVKALSKAKDLPTVFEEIDIQAGVRQHLKDLWHDTVTEDLVFENAHARYRTMLLFNYANNVHGLVVGTGDLSEIALGWCTYNADHIAHFNPNCSVPKTLVKHIVEWYAKTQATELEKVLNDILETKYSPELTGDGKKITQETEELVGPYELHDFFLDHLVRWGSGPEKIFFLAEQVWREKYSKAEIKKWLEVFFTRFFGSQWKRSVATDGPKIGSVSLSPRGDWRMPSDAEAALWLAELEKIQI